MTINLEFNSTQNQKIVLLNTYGVPSAPVVPIYYTLTLNSEIGGVCEPFNDSGNTYLQGTIVAINANPDSGKQFSKWIINGVEYTDKVLYVIMDADTTATAYFTGGVVYDLNISVIGNGSTTPVVGTHQYNSGDGVLINAISVPGSYFESYDIDGILNYNNPLQLTMNSDKNVIANFKDYYEIQISSFGQGIITPSGTTYYKENDQLVVSAIPNQGSYFEKFTVNGVDSVINPLYLTVTDDLTIDCTFKHYHIVDINDAENGLIDPIGILNLKENDDLTITATPNSGYTFVNFDVNGILYTSNPLTISIIDDVTIVTNFEIIPLPVYFELNIAKEGIGSVSPLGCFNKLSGTTTTITASETDVEFIFSHFTINGVTNNNTSITVTSTEDIEVIAYFTKIVKWDLDVSLTGLGTVTPLGCLSKNDNEQTVITATENNSDYYFLNFTVNGVVNTNNPITITSTENKTVVANFSAYNKVLKVFNTKAQLINNISIYNDTFQHNDIFTRNLPSNVFNGTSSAISGTCPLIGQQPIEIEFEIKPTAISGTRTIISWGGFASNKKGMQLFSATGVFQIQYSTGSTNGTKVFTGATIQINNTYYCKFVWNGLASGTPIMTVNGIDYPLASTIGFDWTGDTGDNGVFKIGSSQAATPLNFFAGAITYMKVKNNNVLMMELPIGYGTTSDQSTIWDISGNNRHATLINSVVSTFWNSSSNSLIDWTGVQGATIYYYGSIILAIPGNNNFTITNYTRVGYYPTGIYPSTSKTYVVPVNSTLNSYIPAGDYTFVQLKNLSGANITKIEDTYSISELKIQYK